MKKNLLIMVLTISVFFIKNANAEDECQDTYENGVITRTDCKSGRYEIYDSTGSYIVELSTGDGQYIYYDAPNHKTKELFGCDGNPNSCTAKKVYTDEGSVSKATYYDGKSNEETENITFHSTDGDVLLSLSKQDDEFSIWDNGIGFHYNSETLYLDDEDISINEIKNTTNDIEISTDYDEYKISTEGDIKKMYINGELAFEFSIDENGHISNVKNANGESYNFDFDVDIETNTPSISSFKSIPSTPSKNPKRIYTVEEATAAVKPTGNTFKIRYR